MEEIKTKKIPTTEIPGGHRATVTEETQDPRSTHAQHAKDLIERAGKFMCPIGAEYLGSATVHYYRVQKLDGADQLFLCQAHVEDVSETVASLGWKQLRSALMKSMGRKEPATRQ